jgi:methanogenic corrinoid protein MtbC1
VKPSRSETGRRRYSDADIERLRLLYRATLGGRSIGQVAELPNDALAALVRQDAAAESEMERASEASPLSGLDGQPAADDFLSECLRVVERLDARALEASLRRATVVLPLVTFLDALTAPLLERVGARWREGTLRPVHGHIVSTALRRVLESVIRSASSPPATAKLVIGTPAGQVHEFGALLAAATAAAEGWRVTYLGVDLPAEDIAEAATRTRARAVALSIVYPRVDPALEDELRRLRAALPKNIALIIGGAASSAYGTPLDELGAIRLDNLAQFRAHLRALRSARRRGR